MRKTLRLEDLTAIVDSREQMPLDLHPLKTEIASLTTGDYSLRGLEQYVAIERKSLQDLVQCIGQDRERFERQIQRLRGYETKAVVVEASWQDLADGKYRGKLNPKSAVGSVLSWQESGVPFCFVGNHASACEAVAKLLWFSANRRWKILAALGFAHIDSSCSEK